MGRDIMIKKLTSGSGESASIGTIVTCNMKGYLAEGEFEHHESAFEELKHQQFKIGESDAFPGLELALRHASCGEVFLLKAAAKFAFGQIGRPEITSTNSSAKSSTEQSNDELKAQKVTIPAIPPNTDLFYHVEVTKHIYDSEVDRDILQAILNEQSNPTIIPEVVDALVVPEECQEEYRRRLAVRDILLRKDCGNRWFSYLDYPRAAKAYSKGTQQADNYFKEVAKVEEEQQQAGSESPVADRDLAVVHVYVACLNNLSACYLGMGERCCFCASLLPVLTQLVARRREPEGEGHVREGARVRPRQRQGAAARRQGHSGPARESSVLHSLYRC